MLGLGLGLGLGLHCLYTLINPRELILQDPYGTNEILIEIWFLNIQFWFLKVAII